MTSTVTPALPPLQTLSNISALLERANSVYERLVDHRHTLDRLLSQVSSSSNSPPTSSTVMYTAIPTGSRGGSGHYLMVSEGHPAGSGTEGMVNRSIQVLSWVESIPSTVQTCIQYMWH